MNVTYDFTWELYDCWIFTQLELNLAILASCAPTLRPLVKSGLSALQRHVRQFKVDIPSLKNQIRVVRTTRKGDHEGLSPRDISIEMKHNLARK